MKKGCFFIFVIIPVAVGTLYYVYQKYGDDLMRKGNERLIGILEEKIENEFDNFGNGKYADSLKVYFDNVMDKISKENRDLAEQKMRKMYNELKITVDRNLGDSLNFENIKKVILDYEH